jgi:phage terminase small subunit
MSKKALTKALRAEVDKSDLNEHHKLFCLYYVQNHNATQAYVNAYGCTRRTAGVNGHALLKKTEIKTEIQRLQKLIEEDMGVDSMSMIRFCLKVVGADIGDYLEFRPQEIDVTAPDGTTTKGTISSVIVKDSDYCDTSLIKSIRQQGASVHVELYSKQWAWDKLDKFFGWSTAKQESGENMSIVIAMAEARRKKLEKEAADKENCITQIKNECLSESQKV